MSKNTLFHDKSDIKATIEIDESLTSIINWFESDTIELLDLALCDSEEDPQYSANSTINRINDLIRFYKIYCNKNLGTVRQFLKRAGYEKKDIDLLFKKQKEEIAMRNSLPYYWEVEE